mmetsp:Transcript_118646/g.378185  ORF Transcript_118646/g.378185 Transcript_118646/m.378185 type:complete len:316 (+) Transcript_118646:1891-2838(+)
MLGAEVLLLALGRPAAEQEGLGLLADLADDGRETVDDMHRVRVQSPQPHLSGPQGCTEQSLRFLVLAGHHQQSCQVVHSPEILALVRQPLGLAQLQAAPRNGDAALAGGLRQPLEARFGQLHDPQVTSIPLLRSLVAEPGAVHEPFRPALGDDDRDAEVDTLEVPLAPKQRLTHVPRARVRRPAHVCRAGPAHVEHRGCGRAEEVRLLCASVEARAEVARALQQHLEELGVGLASEGPAREDLGIRVVEHDDGVTTRCSFQVQGMAPHPHARLVVHEDLNVCTFDDSTPIVWTCVGHPSEVVILEVPRQGSLALQ